MKFIADFHIHSKYSRATSKDMTLEELDRWADDKGILVLATGDFTHPEWFKEIKEKLEPAEAGLFKLKSQHKKKTIKGTLAETRFFLSTEISGIYSRQGRTYRIHNLIFVPAIETVEKINVQLGRIGNLESDGRPILGLDSRELVKIVLNTNSEAMIVPSHCWTPWFSLFGSMSGFDSIEECFGEYSKDIFALESGLSSDPRMNWRLSKLDNISIISNSDSHSLQRIGREANIFDTELSYRNIVNAIKSRNPQKFLATIEFFPEEGKYHFDGHRFCGIVFSPEETKKHNGICPKCGRRLTIGVMNRVEKLADRPPIESASRGFYQSYNNHVPFYNLVPLDEIIAEALGVGTGSKGVKSLYEKLVRDFGNELTVLREISIQDLGLVNPMVAEGIKRVRERKLIIAPGYDGEYGTIKIFDDDERASFNQTQAALF